MVAMPLLVDAERLPWRTYTTDDGLPSNTVQKILRDSNGYLWFGTDRGLARLDGRTFTGYGPEHGIASRGIHDLVEANSGDLWMAGRAGLYVLHLKESGANRKLHECNSATIRQRRSD